MVLCLKFSFLRLWRVALVLALWGMMVCAPLWANDDGGQASILNPRVSNSQTFFFTADAIDPSAGFQGDLAIYTPASSVAVPENLPGSPASVTVIVNDQVITSVGTGVASI